MEMSLEKKKMSIGSLVKEMNTQLRAYGKTTVENVYNGSNKHYLLVHHKGNTLALSLDLSVLNNKYARLPFNELVVLAKCLVDFNQKTIGIVKDGVLVRVFTPDDVVFTFNDNFARDWTKYKITEQEPYGSQIREVISKHLNTGNLDFNLVKTNRFKKLGKIV